jgi:predicted Zn-dependent protease
MKKIYLLLIFILCLNSYSQSYQPFDTISLQNKKAFLKELENRHDEKIKQIKKDFSGKISKGIEAVYTDQWEDFSRTVKKNEIYFDKELQNYADKIIAEIKATNPEINKKKITMYFSRDSEPNAYSIGDGTIVFNLELLKYLDDEAEFTYVICHEIAHFILNHRDNSIQTNVLNQNDKEIKKAEKEIKKSKYNKQLKSEKLAQSSIYSRKNRSRLHEFQADSLGLVYFKKMKYNSFASVNMLKNLSKTDIELDSLPQKSYPKNFTTKNQKFLKEWLVSEDYSKYNYSKEHFFKWNVDSLKTHPDCDQRIEKIKKEVTDKKSNYNIDKSFFNELKGRVDFEQVFNYFYMEEYGRSLYETLKLREKNPKNTFLTKMMALNLESLAKAKKEMKLNSYIPLINPIEQTKSEQYYFNFMSNLTLSEFQQLAADYKAQL